MTTGHAPGSSEALAAPMSIDQLLARSALIIPLLHVVTCALYMVGYGRTFGGDVIGLFNASDFLTITLRNLVSTYVFALGLPALLLLRRHRSGNPYLADQIAAEPDEVKRGKLIDHGRAMRRLFSIALPILGLVVVVPFIISALLDLYLSYYLTVSYLAMVVSPLWWKFAASLRLYGIAAEVAWVGIAFVFGVISLGADQGQLDRRLPFTSFKADFMKCGHNVIIGTAGGKFISVTPDNRRHIIDGDCATKFTFPLQTTLGTISFYDEIVERMTRRATDEKR